MITEDYVSYEVAKLLKEKGFDIPVRYEYHFVHNINQKPQFHRHLHNFNGEEYGRLRSKWYSAPTLQMACKWLREEKRLVISIDLNYSDNSYSYIIDSIIEHRIVGYGLGKTYEEAVEAAIKVTLENLI